MEDNEKKDEDKVKKEKEKKPIEYPEPDDGFMILKDVW